MNGTLVLSSAGTYLIREADPADADLIADFISGLSVQAQYFRFFTAVAPPSRGLVRLLSDSSRADLLVVTDDRGAIVGHGMAVDGQTAPVTSTDLGIVIADGLQGNGLGTRLLDLLVARASQRGVTRLDFEVLPDNARMLGIIDRRCPGASRKRTADSVSIMADITAWPQPAAGGQPSAALPPAALPVVTEVRGTRPPGFQGAQRESRPHAA